VHTLFTFSEVYRLKKVNEQRKLVIIYLVLSAVPKSTAAKVNLKFSF